MGKNSFYLLFSLIIFESCSKCGFVEIYRMNYSENAFIVYRMINPKCPSVDRDWAFVPYVSDSAKRFTYYLFREYSEKVLKLVKSRNGKASYKLDYDSSSSGKLDDLDKTIFERIIKLGDSLGVKDFRYLLDGRKFQLIKKSPAKKK